MVGGSAAPWSTLVPDANNSEQAQQFQKLLVSLDLGLGTAQPALLFVHNDHEIRIGSNDKTNFVVIVDNSGGEEG